MNKLLEISKNLKDNYESLFDLFRSNDFDYRRMEYSSELEAHLLFLFNSDIARPKSFEMLLFFNKTVAFEILDDFYFFDDKSHGDTRYPFHDLDLLFSAIVEIFGKDELQKFLKRPIVSRRFNKNKRIREAVEFALD